MIRTRKSIRDPKVLKDKIMANLKEKGILNELQARFLSNISIEIQNSNYVVYSHKRFSLKVLYISKGQNVYGYQNISINNIYN